MIEKFEFTKDELTEAFSIWNAESLNNPDEFREIDKSKECAKDQAEKIISILTSKS